MKRFAILIGCEEYTNFSNIWFCCADVELVRSVLTDYCDYDDADVEVVHQYKGCDENAEYIYERLATLVDKAENGDTILFYFAGHGAKDGDKGYLLLADSTVDYEKSALNLKKINDILNTTKITGIIILDACHSGISARSIFSPLYAESIKRDMGCITLASCSENQESYPYSEKEQGVFTYFLAEEIKKKDTGTEILLEQLKIDVCKRVELWAKENFKNQTPTLTGSAVGNVPFAVRNQKKYDNVSLQKSISSRETIINNMGKALTLFGEKASLVLDETVNQGQVVSSTPIVAEERKSLFYPILKKWMQDEYKASEIFIMKPDTQWKVFGENYTFSGLDSNGKDMIIMLNVLNKMNYSNVIHAFKNLNEVRKYYESFGKGFNYHQIVLIKKEREDELRKVIKTHTKIKSLFQNKAVFNEVVYLEKGTFGKLLF